MSRQSKTIAKNVSAMLAAQAMTWSLTFVLTIFLPRSLGPDATGELYFAISIWAIAGVLIRCGMDVHLTKAIARDPTQAPELLGTTLAVRSLLYVAGLAAVAVYLAILRYSAPLVIVVVIIGVSTLLDLWLAAFTAAFQGLENMGAISLASVASKIIFTVVCLGALALGMRVYVIAAIYILASAAGLITLLVLYLRRYPLHIRLRPAAAWSIVRTSAPYLMSSMVIILYGEIDKQIIASMIDTRSIGWYGVAVNLFGTLMFLPVILTTALFPSLTRAAADTPDALGTLARKSFDLLFLIGIPIGFGMMAIAQPLVQLLYGTAFAPAGTILALLGVVIVFTYQNILFAQLLMAADRPNVWTIVLIISLVVTVALDIVLVPWCQRLFNNGALAGAITYLLIEAAQVIAGILLLPHGTFAWSNVRTALLSLISGLAMVGVCWLTQGWFILVPVLAGAVVYGTMVLVLRILPPEDFATLQRFAQQALVKIWARRSASASVTEG